MEVEEVVAMPEMEDITTLALVRDRAEKSVEDISSSIVPNMEDITTLALATNGVEKPVVNTSSSIMPIMEDRTTLVLVRNSADKSAVDASGSIMPNDEDGTTLVLVRNGANTSRITGCKRDSSPSRSLEKGKKIKTSNDDVHEDLGRQKEITRDVIHLASTDHSNSKDKTMSEAINGHLDGGTKVSQVVRCSSPLHHSQSEVSTSRTIGSSSTRENQSSNSDNSTESPSASKKLICEKKLTRSDVGDLNRLVIPINLAEAHFPCLKMNNQEYKKVVLNFCDKENKLWAMKYEFTQKSKSYSLTSGWKAFVKHYGLCVDDLIRIYDVATRRQQHEQPEGYGKQYAIEHCQVRGIKTFRLFGSEISAPDPTVPNSSEGEGDLIHGIRVNGDVDNRYRPNGGIRRIRKR